MNLDASQMRRLEGTYRRRGSLVSFKVDTYIFVDNLVLVAGSEKQTLEAHSETGFSLKSMRYTFVADSNGAIRGITVAGPDYSNIAVEFWPLNDTPYDKPGPDRPSWREIAGRYAGQEYGQKVSAEVVVKNGYLYLDGPEETDWHGNMKLREDQPELFFTADGESVEFGSGKMAIGNRPFLKQI